MTAPWHDCPPSPCGHNIGCPIRDCPRQDCAQHAVETSGANLWCPACGEFWKGSEDDVLKAEMAAIAWAEEGRGR